MRSLSPVRILLPAAQALAEGGWLAVLYAAAQAAAGGTSHFGPIELGAAALAGMAWGRRRRWRSPVMGAVGLPLLALVAGLLGWLLDPDVRLHVVEGNLILALGMHPAGWLAALAFWRGEAHRFREDDALIQERLLRWAVPALAIPWLIGYSAASGQLEKDFAAAAFVGTVFFSGSAFTALGLARLEAERLSGGSDWRSKRSWLLMIIGAAVILTAITLPAAALMGIPGRSLLATMVAPLQTLLLLLVLVSAPIFLLAAIIADLLAQLLPDDFELFGGLTFPRFSFSGARPTSDLPGIILSVIVASVFAFEIIILLAMAWMSLRRRWKMADPTDEAFEERSIIVPDSSPGEPADALASRSRRIGPTDDPTGAYLAALGDLASDGRWPRREHETPAAHLARARAEGLTAASFGRLAAAYQLARYSLRTLPRREGRRARQRLDDLRRWLRSGYRS